MIRKRLCSLYKSVFVSRPTTSEIAQLKSVINIDKQEILSHIHEPEAKIFLKEHVMDISAKIKLFEVVKNLDLETADYDTQFLKTVMENAWGTQAPTNGLSLAKSCVRNKFQTTRDNKELPFPENCIGYRIIKYLVLLILYAYTHRYDMAEGVPRVRNFGYTIAKYRDMLCVYFAYNLVGRAAGANYRQQFLNRRHPDAATFQLLRRGSDNTSLRLIARFLGTSYSTCQRVMKDEGQHAYKYRCIHGICNHLIFQEHERDAEFLNKILWTDEATYVRTGIANPHNEHYWADKNPHLAREAIISLYRSFSINVWVGIIGNQLIGPFKLPARLDGPNHLEFLQNDLPRLLKESLTEEQRRNLIFMHDGAPAHFAIDVRNHLDQIDWTGMTYSMASALPQFPSIGLFLLGIFQGTGVPQRCFCECTAVVASYRRACYQCRAWRNAMGDLRYPPTYTSVH
ncbi:hypothetical protein TSAR_016331 [Trichomalopsis sarcophagae]|uniref:DUF4817 domain-containing protein n=1 Tax=Trichomalopsis sarcophagae TaxID=543379 RepID=A0A232EWJ5_9HYME|nr:hypothetical protein TSAR_016331 [Trichomalopsis sarcophagae]